MNTADYSALKVIMYIQWSSQKRVSTNTQRIINIDKFNMNIFALNIVLKKHKIGKVENGPQEGKNKGR